MTKLSRAIFLTLALWTGLSLALPNPSWALRSIQSRQNPETVRALSAGLEEGILKELLSDPDTSQQIARELRQGSLETLRRELSHRLFREGARLSAIDFGSILIWLLKNFPLSRESMGKWSRQEAPYNALALLLASFDRLSRANLSKEEKVILGDTLVIPFVIEPLDPDFAWHEDLSSDRLVANVADVLRGEFDAVTIAHLRDELRGGRLPGWVGELRGGYRNDSALMGAEAVAIATGQGWYDSRRSFAWHHIGNAYAISNAIFGLVGRELVSAGLKELGQKIQEAMQLPAGNRVTLVVATSLTPESNAAVLHFLKTSTNRNVGDRVVLKAGTTLRQEMVLGRDHPKWVGVATLHQLQDEKTPVPDDGILPNPDPVQVAALSDKLRKSGDFQKTVGLPAALLNEIQLLRDAVNGLGDKKKFALKSLPGENPYTHMHPRDLEVQGIGETESTVVKLHNQYPVVAREAKIVGYGPETMAAWGEVLEDSGAVILVADEAELQLLRPLLSRFKGTPIVVDPSNSAQMTLIAQESTWSAGLEEGDRRHIEAMLNQILEWYPQIEESNAVSLTRWWLAEEEPDDWKAKEKGISFILDTLGVAGTWNGLVESLLFDPGGSSVIPDERWHDFESRTLDLTLEIREHVQDHLMEYGQDLGESAYDELAKKIGTILRVRGFLEILGGREVMLNESPSIKITLADGSELEQGVDARRYLIDVASPRQAVVRASYLHPSKDWPGGMLALEIGRKSDATGLEEPPVSQTPFARGQSLVERLASYKVRVWQGLVQADDPSRVASDERVAPLSERPEGMEFTLEIPMDSPAIRSLPADLPEQFTLWVHPTLKDAVPAQWGVVKVEVLPEKLEEARTVLREKVRAGDLVLLDKRHYAPSVHRSWKALLAEAARQGLWVAENELSTMDRDEFVITLQILRNSGEVLPAAGLEQEIEGTQHRFIYT